MKQCCQKTRTEVAKDFVKFLEKDEYFMYGGGEHSEFILRWERQKKKYNIRTKITEAVEECEGEI